MAHAHRPLRITIILLFTLSMTALGLLQTAQISTSAAPVLEVTGVPVVATATTTPPTTIAPKVVVAPKARPVAPPKNSYAPEPIVQIGQMEIPKIGLVTPIFHGITMRNINLGPSHWPGTAMPGEVGNAVFAGHRTTYSKPFGKINQLVPGDQVIYTINGARFVYSVTGHEIVTPDALWIADQTPTPTATIFACHPPGSARYRYVVRMAMAQ